MRTADPTSPTHRRRAQVVNAVRELVAEQGLRLSMDAVAARAGCSKQTLYSHYGSRQNLLRSVIAEHQETSTRSLAAPGDDLRTALLAFALEHRAHLADPNTTAARRLLIAEAPNFASEASDLHRTAVDGLIARVARRLRQAMDCGELRQASGDCAAELLLAMIVGLDGDRALYATDAASGSDWAEYAIDSFLRAFAPD